ncbi:hypothetical protein chiPu_0024744, partial [Chiloscyllium punctatum]|nr:hypothetical protein [Chiloscyllium punctatum]
MRDPVAQWRREGVALHTAASANGSAVRWVTRPLLLGPAGGYSDRIHANGSQSAAGGRRLVDTSVSVSGCHHQFIWREMAFFNIQTLLEAAEFIERREREAEHGYASILPCNVEFNRKKGKTRKTPNN